MARASSIFGLLVAVALLAVVDCQSAGRITIDFHRPVTDGRVRQVFRLLLRQERVLSVYRPGFRVVRRSPSKFEFYAYFRESYRRVYSTIRRRFNEEANQGRPCPTAAPNGQKYAKALNFKWKGLAPQQIRIGNPRKIAVIGRHWRQGKRYGPGVSEYAPVLSRKIGKPVEIFTRFRSTKAARKDWNAFLKRHAKANGCKNQHAAWTKNKKNKKAAKAWEACWKKTILPDRVVVQTKFFGENKKWAQNLAKRRFTVVDIGNPYDRTKSPFYQAELRALFGKGTKPAVVNLRVCNAYHPQSRR